MRRRSPVARTRTSIGMTCLALLLALAGCGDNAFAPAEGEVASIGVVAFSRSSANGNANGGTGSGKSGGTVASVTPGAGNVGIGVTLQLVAYDANGNQVSPNWSSSNTAVASVSSSGLVTGVSAGSSSVTAKTKNQSATAEITVLAGTPAATVQVSPSTATVEIGKTAQLSAAVKDAAGNLMSDAPLLWASSNTAVAKVSSSGVVTAVASGLVQIAATSGGVSGMAEVVVPSSSAPAPAPSFQGVPQAPATGAASLLFDFRRGSTMPQKHGGGFAEAKSFADVVGSIGSGNMNNGWGATANVDGKGTRALMGTYSGPTDCNAQQEKKANLQLIRSAPVVYFSYMTRLGRSSTGEGFPDGAPARGKVDAFRAQSAHCEDKGGKRLRFVQEALTYPDGSFDRPEFSHQWRGGDVNTDVRGDLAGEPGAHVFSEAYSTEAMVGKPVRITVEVRASSGLSGSMERYKRFNADGVVRMWVDGVLAFEGTAITIGSTAFTRINLMSRLNSPSFDMTDYWWDMVAWEPTSL
jgi:hypothetical protein